MYTRYSHIPRRNNTRLDILFQLLLTMYRKRVKRFLSIYTSFFSFLFFFSLSLSLMPVCHLTTVARMSSSMSMISSCVVVLGEYLRRISYVVLEICYPAIM